MQGWIVAGMVLLALYGIAQAFIKASLYLVRPKRPRITMVVQIGKTAQVEQQVRYARLLAREYRVPLVVVADDAEDEGLAIVRRMVRKGDVPILFEENVASDACTARQNRV